VFGHVQSTREGKSHERRYNHRNRLGKSTLHGVDRTGRDVLQRTVRREHGAHEWGRQFGALGHSVRVMAPTFVIPYRKSGKNDGNDAAARCAHWFQ